MDLNFVENLNKLFNKTSPTNRKHPEGLDKVLGKDLSDVIYQLAPMPEQRQYTQINKDSINNLFKVQDKDKDSVEAIVDLANFMGQQKQEQAAQRLDLPPSAAKQYANQAMNVSPEYSGILVDMAQRHNANEIDNINHLRAEQRAVERRKQEIANQRNDDYRREIMAAIERKRARDDQQNMQRLMINSKVNNNGRGSNDDDKTIYEKVTEHLKKTGSPELADYEHKLKHPEKYTPEEIAQSHKRLIGAMNIAGYGLYPEMMQKGVPIFEVQGGKEYNFKKSDFKDYEAAKKILKTYNMEETSGIFGFNKKVDLKSPTSISMFGKNINNDAERPEVQIARLLKDDKAKDYVANILSKDNSAAAQQGLYLLLEKPTTKKTADNAATILSEYYKNISEIHPGK